MPNKRLKIGVFDSGIGGLSVARAVKKALPLAEVIFVTDPEHFPYATKSPDKIWVGIVPIFQGLIDQQCDAIVVACNTVSTTLIDRLRQKFSVPFVALEPMVKPAAAQTNTGIIAVCATPTTLASAHYKRLKQDFAVGVTVLEPDCSDWSRLIEQNAINEADIRETIRPALTAGADVIVLGCTHYHWIEQEILEICAGKAQVIQPESAIIKQLNAVLARLP